MNKVRLKLQQLEGRAECFLEIELSDQEDYFITFQGQDTKGQVHRFSAQLLNPINHGGMKQLKEYEIITDLYRKLNKE